MKLREDKIREVLATIQFGIFCMLSKNLKIKIYGTIILMHYMGVKLDLSARGRPYKTTLENERLRRIFGPYVLKGLVLD
jgi:hypothetical protein